MASLPLSPNGKIDRKALPDPDVSHLHSAYVAPRTETETLLCGMWCDLLGAERVGVTDNFFELGGHSLLAIRFLSKVRAVLKVDVPVHAVFSSATIEHVATYIDALLMNDNNSDTVSEEFMEEGTF
jgi:hypothetical protein